MSKEYKEYEITPEAFEWMKENYDEIFKDLIEEEKNKIKEEWVIDEEE